ncbi:piggyBac transposable element-derived protein 2-like [Phlebotomus papatasi]|uniref:piggyBac transposable element-derived protein 2-like n=1 Tax=Phlebotomus papatasi TaxID=29031 RepID=UPI0024835C69|nr:piggyBac transposable element-derived protein 2-like [Phlebotomus papatasi]XP_055710858.1 piggyBac transposable element-derived protein 2-like [Phlebotomus papatasi]XP_055710859.1 piggyBac transposable element-derived protein 2-like [Phlebotomus papatasi]
MSMEKISILFPDNSDGEECFGEFDDNEFIKNEEIFQENLNSDLGKSIPSIAKTNICLLFPDHSDDEEDFEGFDENELMTVDVNVKEEKEESQENLSQDLGEYTSTVDDIIASGQEGQKEGDIKITWSKDYANSSHGESLNNYPFGAIKIELDNEDFSPYNVFLETLCFTELANLICSESELYMYQKGHRFELKEDELKAFLGINMIMSYHVLPSFKDYWSKDPDIHVPYIASVMTRKRFLEIRNALHFNDNLMADKSDRAYKVRPLINHFNMCFQKTKEPTKQQTIGEHMIKFKGKNAMKQYVHKGPIKWGFKMWCRCDSTSGYLFEFDLCQGKKSQSQYELGEGVVLKLCKEIENIGCEVFFDKFFNTVRLQCILLRKRIFACGTVQKHRRHLPDLIPDRKMKTGDVDWRSSGRIVCVKWMDTCSVTLLSNYISPMEMVKVQRQQSDTSEKLQLNCPKIIQNYNQHMNGVHIMNLKKSYYDHDRKSTTKSYLKLFFDLMDIGMNNACIVYNEMSQERGIGSLTLLEFRQEVARCLIGDYMGRTRAPPAIKPSNELCQPLEHCPIWAETRSRCYLCYRKNKVDSRIFCKCEGCNVYLCFNSARNCFREYHNEPWEPWQF